MDRRRFLRCAGVTAGALAAGGGLAACGDSGPVPAADPTLNMIIPAWPEQLRGEGRRVVFSLTDLDNTERADAEVEVYVTDADDRVVSGPFPADYFADDDLRTGFYRTFVDFPEEGTAFLAAVQDADHGRAAVNVIDPGDSSHPVPGDAAVASPTPTVEDPGGVDDLCTGDPDCGMHETSLADALERGLPTVVLFATPAYCQTAVCAPAVAHLDELRRARDWGSLAFVHVEIFSDAGTTVAEAVHDWGLPSEPWLYTIDGSGTVVERLDGPMVAAELDEVVGRLADSV